MKKERSLEEILKDFVNLGEPQKPKTKTLPWNAVIDADKSVSWNREEVEKNNRKYVEEQSVLNIEFNRRRKLLINEVCDYISMELDVSSEAAKYIWRYAFEKSPFTTYWDIFEYLKEIIKLVKISIDSLPNAEAEAKPLVRFEKVGIHQYCYDFMGYPYTETYRGVKKDYDEIQLPKKRYKTGAYYEFFAPHEIILESQSIHTIYTGVKCRMSDSHVLKVYPKSSIEVGVKGIVSLDSPCVLIESDYYDNGG